MKIQQQDDLDVDIRIDSPEESSIYILTALRILNYQPDVDPVTFRYILNILIIKNKETDVSLAYLNFSKCA